MGTRYIIQELVGNNWLNAGPTFPSKEAAIEKANEYLTKRDIKTRIIKETIKIAWVGKSPKTKME